MICSMINSASPLVWLVFALIASVLVLVFLWQTIAPHSDVRDFLRDFMSRRIDGVLRIWRFVGPRLTHKPTVAMFVGNAAILFGVDVEQMSSLTVALWMGANLLFPPWDDLPVETLRPATALARGPGVDLELK